MAVDTGIVRQCCFRQVQLYLLVHNIIKDDVVEHKMMLGSLARLAGLCNISMMLRDALSIEACELLPLCYHAECAKDVHESAENASAASIRSIRDDNCRS